MRAAIKKRGLREFVWVILTDFREPQHPQRNAFLPVDPASWLLMDRWNPLNVAADGESHLGAETVKNHLGL